MATETISNLARQGYQGETSLSDTNYWIGYYKITYNSTYTMRFKFTPQNTWTAATFTINAASFQGGTKMTYHCKLSTSSTLQIPKSSDKTVTWSNNKATITFSQTFSAGTPYYLFVDGVTTGDFAVYTGCNASVTGTIYVAPTPDPTPTRVEEATVITSVSNFTLGSAVTVKFKPKYSDYKYKIKYIIGSVANTTGYISPATTSEYTYSSYSPPLATYGPAFSATSTTATMTIELYTYLPNNSQVGTKQSKTCTATMPNNSNTQPTVTLTASNPTPNVNSYTHFHGATTTTWSFTTTTKYNATITSAVLKRGSTSVYTVNNTGSGSKALVDYTTGGTAGSSGAYTVNYTMTVTDSRGFTKTSSTVAQTCYSYTAPNITSYSTVRCNSSGNESASDSSLTYANSKIAATYSSYGGNTITTRKIATRSPGGSWSNKADFTVSSTATTTRTSSYNINNSYEFRYTLTDSVGKSAVQYDMLSPVYFIMDFKAGGKSIGMFGAAPEQRTTASIFEVFGDFVTGGRIILTSNNYGTSTPTAANSTTGQLFFVKQT